jgi:UDP-N-acetylglucosamine--N-acetylmuramyl-(pentapeptide) pyrophosphoryl-undecaprenol N-acetylglucosamine transferase
MKKIVFTGGGSAGHVTPNLALFPKLKKRGWDIHYIGSKNGIERELIERTSIPYYSISSGKLRRYFDLKNFKDPFNVMKGVLQAYVHIRKLKPDVIFSKGGFVSVPVVIAGWLNKIPVLIHESDITPGLANKISVNFATKVFVTFDEAKDHFPNEKVVVAGSPIREELLAGSKEKGLHFLRFADKKPVITIMGGSQGSRRLNTTIRDLLDDLEKAYQIVHLCGKGNIDGQYEERSGYRQFEYLSDELPDVLAASNMVISRAGSNSIFEFLALRKPMILIPLPRSQSRGDQILNAESFQSKGFCRVLEEESLTHEALKKAISEVYKNRYDYIDTMHKQSSANSLDDIIQSIEKESR